MPYRFANLLLSVMCAGLASCARTELPEQRPADLSISLHGDGGMLPEGYSYELGKDSCVAAYHDGESRHRFRFTLRPGEWDTLYQLFRRQRFDRIRTHDEEIYDRGGSSLSLRWKEQQFAKSNSGMSVVNEGWQDNYRFCREAVESLVRGKLNEQKKNVTLHFNHTLFRSGFRWELQVEAVADTYPEKYDVYYGDQDSLVLRLLPGAHRLLIEGFRPRQEKPVMGYELTLDTKQHEFFHLRLDSGEVKITPFVRVSAFFMDEGEVH